MKSNTDGTICFKNHSGDCYQTYSLPYKTWIWNSENILQIYSHNSNKTTCQTS